MVFPALSMYFGKCDNKQQSFSSMDLIFSIASAYEMSLCNKQYSGLTRLIRLVLSSARNPSSVMRRALMLIPLRTNSRCEHALASYLGCNGARNLEASGISSLHSFVPFEAKCRSFEACDDILREQ